MKVLPAAARDDATVEQALAALAEQVARLARYRERAIVGPLFQQDNAWWRVIAFAGKAAAVSTMAAALSRELPTIDETAKLISALRRLFSDVEVHANAIEWARSAQRAWPSDRADQLVDIALRGDPGIQAFR